MVVNYSCIPRWRYWFCRVGRVWPVVDGITSKPAITSEQAMQQVWMILRQAYCKQWVPGHIWLKTIARWFFFPSVHLICSVLPPNHLQNSCGSLGIFYRCQYRRSPKNFSICKFHNHSKAEPIGKIVQQMLPATTSRRNFIFPPLDGPSTPNCPGFV